MWCVAAPCWTHQPIYQKQNLRLSMSMYVAHATKRSWMASLVCSNVILFSMMSHVSWTNRRPFWKHTIKQCNIYIPNSATDSVASFKSLLIINDYQMFSICVDLCWIKNPSGRQCPNLTPTHTTCSSDWWYGHPTSLIAHVSGPLYAPMCFTFCRTNKYSQHIVHIVGFIHQNKSLKYQQHHWFEP